MDQMLLVQGWICQRCMAFFVSTDCVRFAKHCGKIYSRHFFCYTRLYFEACVHSLRSVNSFLILQCKSRVRTLFGISGILFSSWISPGSLSPWEFLENSNSGTSKVKRFPILCFDSSISMINFLSGLPHVREKSGNFFFFMLREKWKILYLVMAIRNFYWKSGENWKTDFTIRLAHAFFWNSLKITIS